MAEVPWKRCYYEQEKWAKHYSSNHQILLVGEGDFSFALSLAFSFGSASNIVASSLDTYDAVIKKYKRAKTNLELLANFGAQLLHGVDATRMMLHTHLQLRKFDRIVYNFPHAGFLGKEDDQQVISLHQKLVAGFFQNASWMLLRFGEVHVTHKATFPFNCWNIEELAAESYLKLLEQVEFKLEDYPGYQNKRGDGLRPDDPFPLGECTTFKFVSSTTVMKSISSHHQQIPLPIANAGIIMNAASVMNNGEYLWIFREYLDYAISTFGVVDDDLFYKVSDTLRMGFERYNAKYGERNLNGYINFLEELRYSSKQKIDNLRNQLRAFDQSIGMACRASF